MSEIIVRSIIGFLILVFVYLVVSFIKLSFNFFLWSEEARFGCALFGTALAVFIAIIPYEFKR